MRVKLSSLTSGLEETSEAEWVDGNRFSYRHRFLIAHRSSAHRLITAHRLIAVHRLSSFFLHKSRKMAKFAQNIGYVP